MIDDPRVDALADAVRGLFPHGTLAEDVAKDLLQIADASDAERGVVRVPYDPSGEMLAAGISTSYEYAATLAGVAGGIWRAMCDAAVGAVPEPPTAPGWRTAVRLSLQTNDLGMVAIVSDAPRNLSVTGLTLDEACRAFAQFARDCEALGKPFDALKGVKLGDGAPLYTQAQMDAAVRVERESCAQIAEEERIGFGDNHMGLQAHACAVVRRAIRARGEAEVG